MNHEANVWRNVCGVTPSRPARRHAVGERGPDAPQRPPVEREYVVSTWTSQGSDLAQRLQRGLQTVTHGDSSGHGRLRVRLVERNEPTPEIDVIPFQTAHLR